MARPSLLALRQAGYPGGGVCPSGTSIRFAESAFRNRPILLHYLASFRHFEG